MMSRLIERWRRKFSAALAGLVDSIRHEDSFVAHTAAAILVIAVACWLQLSAVRCGVLALTIASVFAAELFNTSIEALVRAVHPEHHRDIGRCLDAAAAGVLAISIGAVVVGVFVVGEPLYRVCLGR